MLKFNWVLSTLLVSAVIASELPTQSMQRAVAQTNPFRFKEASFGKIFKQKQDNEPTAGKAGKAGSSVGRFKEVSFRKFPNQKQDNAPTIGQAGVVGAAPRSWETIFGNLFNQHQDNDPSQSAGKGGSRGGVCALTPNPIGTKMEIWSDRPLFAWKGLPPPNRIEVRSVEGDRLLWGQTVTGQRSVLYAGEKLQPGQTYEWKLFVSLSKDAKPVTVKKFRLMDAQKRNDINKELQALGEQLKTASPEDIAKQRAQLFAQKELWSDALQEVYSLQEPSQELIKVVQAVPDKICPKASDQDAARSR